MPTQALCPKCDAPLERQSDGTPPTHCAACGSRIICPRCGAILSRTQARGEPLYCVLCAVDLSGTPTRALDRTHGADPSKVGVTIGPGLHIPGFEVRGEVGRGGMGIVYRAWQTSLGREIALKVLPPALAGDVTLLERFRKEAALAANLLNAHIVPVFDVQEHGGVPVIVMPLIDGCDLGQILRHRLELRKGRQSTEPHPWVLLPDGAYLARVLPALDQVVDGVVALQQAGVFHRDVKPSNVLIDRAGTAWLTDFGLARLAEESGGTVSGMGLGTPGYVSPEQAGGAGDVDARADVFSLGATLYHALTLELPYGKGWSIQPGQIPQRPSRLQPLLPRDLDAVLLKALEPERSRRYADAAALRDDWNRVRQGQPPLARPSWPLLRRAQAVRPYVATLFAGMCVIGLGLALAPVLGRKEPSGDMDHVPGRDADARPDPSAVPRRTVQLETDPVGARVVLVPLEPQTGEALPERAIHPAGATPLRLEGVPAGEYLVVAEVPGHGFHEVFRTIPELHEVATGDFRHSSWEELPSGAVRLPTIRVPGADVTRAMAKFAGGTFQMGSEELVDLPPHKVTVAPFFLDTTEVTMKAYREISGGRLPDELKKNPPPDDYAVREVPFAAAVAYAEFVGKRLPDEAEHEFAATAGGTRRFPWGNGPKPGSDWPLGPVGTPAFDHTDTDPPVFGLYSNVAEWTASWPNLYPGLRPQTKKSFAQSGVRHAFVDARVVRGAPGFVIFGRPPRPGEDGPSLSPRFRQAVTQGQRLPGLGFRCARSERARFLEP